MGADDAAEPCECADAAGGVLGIPVGAVLDGVVGAVLVAVCASDFGVGGPLLQRACLPVEWHGQDLAKTLDSFADWCDALHAGAKAPPPPELALF